MKGLLIDHILSLSVLLNNQMKMKMDDLLVDYNEQLPEEDKRLWGMLAHLSTFLGAVIPVGNIIAPLIIMSYYQNKSKFVSSQAKEALNFQISLLIYYFIAGLSLLVFVGFFLIPFIFITSLIITILAALAANKGEDYKYPLTMRFIK